jgi:DNA-binding transcriptional regulator LsrR (DeoR family)
MTEQKSANSLRAIAEIAGVSRTTVHKAVTRHPLDDPTIRVTGRDGKSYPATRRAQDVMRAYAVILRDRGLTQHQIADQLQISQSTVSRLLAGATR